MSRISLWSALQPRSIHRRAILHRWRGRSPRSLRVSARPRPDAVLPGVLACRAGLQDAVQAFVDASGLPFATMLMDKSTLEEQQPAYIGMYEGKLMDEAVREYVESCDAVVLIGAILTDFSTGAFTAH